MSAPGLWLQRLTWWGRPLPFDWGEFYVFVEDVPLDDEGLPKAPVKLAVLMILPMDPDEAREDFLVADDAEAESFEIVVQGRTLKGVRGKHHEGDNPMPWAAGTEDGAGLVLDLTPEGAERPVLLMMVRQGDEEPISDEEVREFLSSFHVGPDR